MFFSSAKAGAVCMSGAEYDPKRYSAANGRTMSAFPDTGYPLVKSVQGKMIEACLLDDLRIFAISVEDFTGYLQ